ncbi:MAG: family 78 glycoside hydrolase catalytic domain [Clostridia bacterium]|nr:family 78 glycoside hydrolase catalytic domain [Clostridia bacterium]
MLEKAIWITGEYEKATKSACFFFRRAFSLADEVKEAKLFCSAFPMGEFRVNGMLPKGFSPDFTESDAEFAICCRCYDITSLLSKGDNLLSVTIPTGSRFCIEVKGVMKNGAPFALHSDSSWCVTDKTPFFAASSHSEGYDAEKENRDYYLPSFNDAAWDNAKITTGMGGLLLPFRALPVTEEKISLPPKEIKAGIFDFTYTVTGKVRLSVEGKKGDKILLLYAKRMQKNGTPLFDKESDCFILGKSGVNTFSPTFSKHSFRYVQIKKEGEDEESPKIKELSAFALHTDLASVGFFSCSNDTLNTWHEATRRSIRFAFQGSPTFLPDKEENGRCAIGFATSGASLYNYEMKAAYQKWLSDILDAQKRDGQFPALLPAPSKYEGSGSAADGTALILLPYEYYLYTGDSALLSLSWDGMKAYMQFLSHLEEDGILHFGENDIHNRSDAAYCPPELPGTALYYRFAEVMARTAPLMDESAKEYEKLASRIRSAFRDRFIENGHLICASQNALACTLAMRLEEEDETEEMLEDLLAVIREGNNRFDVGMIGLGFLLTALGEHNKIEAAFGMILQELLGKEDAPRTRLWNYPNFCDIDKFLFRYIAGIRPTPHSLTIAPFLPDGIEYVRAAWKNTVVDFDKKRIRIVSDTPFYLLYGGEEHYLPQGEYNFPANK